MFQDMAPRDAILWGIIALLVGAVLVYFMFQPHIMDRNIIKIDIAEEGTKVVTFDDFSILPGAESEYTFMFNEVDVTGYDVSMQFKTEADYSSYNFIHVRIIVDGEVLHDKPLNEMFALETVFLYIKPHIKRDVEAKVVYYVPLDVGNEAENAQLSFDVVVTATSHQPLEEVIQ